MDQRQVNTTADDLRERFLAMSRQEKIAFMERLADIFDEVEAQWPDNDTPSLKECNCFKNSTLLWERCPVHGGGV